MSESAIEDLRRAGRRALLRFAGWPRRLVVLGCVVLAGTSALAAAHQQRAPVVVAVRAVPAGQALTAADVAVRQWPAAAVPAQALHRVGDVRGHVLALAITVGEPVTTARLVGPELGAGRPPGTVVLAVPVSASARTLAQPGIRVDLLHGPPTDACPAPATGGVVVARDVLVLAVLDPSSGRGMPADPGLSSDDPAQLTVLTVSTDASTSERLAVQCGGPFVVRLRTP